ncbi:MAG TPA: hypothetical protein VFB96_24265 [Pirellulaceae bacterium]|nr:hypothetical protein [Pirellulaceae bacterium]
MSPETYRQKLTRLARALASADALAVAGDLAAGCPPRRARMFTDGNCEKRFEKLADQLEFIAPAFDDFAGLIEAFIRNQPLAAYDTGASDGEQMLLWLTRTQPCTAEQLDHIACQRGRHAVEDLARCNRLGHTHFQELRSVTPSEERELRLLLACGVTLHLNPIRIWTTFHTRVLLDDEAGVPAAVILFPVGSEIAIAVLEDDARPLVSELARLGPCSLAQWSAVTTRADSDRLEELVGDLAGLGLVAVA